MQASDEYPNYLVVHLACSPITRLKSSWARRSGLTQSGSRQALTASGHRVLSLLVRVAEGEVELVAALHSVVLFELQEAARGELTGQLPERGAIERAQRLARLPIAVQPSIAAAADDRAGAAVDRDPPVDPGEPAAHSKRDDRLRGGHPEFFGTAERRDEKHCYQ